MAKRVRSVRALSGFAAVIVAGAMLAGCSSAATEPPGLNASTSPTATPSSDPHAADVAAIRKVHDAYRAAVLASENGPDANEAPFFGIASSEITGAQIARAAGFVETNMRRVGAPKLDEPVITVTGDTARLEVCMNQDTWTAVTTDGQPIFDKDGSAPHDGASPSVLDLNKAAEKWLVTRVVPVAEATVLC